VTLSGAVELALSRNPRLRAGAAGVKAAEGREHQAGVLPNPEIEAEVEDIGVSGEERGFDASIYTVRAAQTFELGGKRAKRRRAAGLETDLADWDLAAIRLDLIAETRGRFVDLLAAQERLRVVTAAYDLGGKVRAVAAERVKSGKVPALELTKANVELTGRRVELRRAERELAAAQTALGALWNTSPAESLALRAEGQLRQNLNLQAPEALARRLGVNPDLARWDSEEDLAQAAVAQEKAARIPDVTLSAGLSHEQESGNQLVLFAVSLPLPLFDRNKGNIDAARAELDKVREERIATQIRLRAELAGQWQELQSALEETAAIENEMLPGAREAFDAAEEAYRSGKVEYLDVLDAQQTLFEAEMQLVESLTTLHQKAIGIERLVGGDLYE
jgi:cobalt-zinc-cadmium efflux system outer membrane protein